MRSDTSAASPLSNCVAPLLRSQLDTLFSFVRTNWPQITLKQDEFDGESQKIRSSLFGDDSTQWDARSIFKPRLLVKGPRKNGQNMIACALLDSINTVKIVKVTVYANLLFGIVPLIEQKNRFYSEIKNLNIKILFS